MSEKNNPSETNNQITYVRNYIGRSLSNRENILLYDLIDAMSMSGVNYSNQDLLNSFQFNSNFLKENKLTNMEFGYNDKFFLRRVVSSSNLHPESVIEYHILKYNPALKNKDIVSTFGFYFTVKDNKVVLNISNIQGHLDKNIKNFNKKALELSEQRLKSLNDELLTNWRVKIVSFLKKYAENKGYDICLQLPYKTQYQNGDYLRQIRQYIQAGLKAGLKVEQISPSRINDAKIKEKITNNLNFKKKNVNSTLNKAKSESTFLRFKKFVKKK